MRDTTIVAYLTCVRRFRAHWRSRGIDEIERLTVAQVRTFAGAYVGPRRGMRVGASARLLLQNALHAWSCALGCSGESVPPWHASAAPRRWPPLITEYGEYRRAHRGIATGTLARDLEVASDFVRSLHSGHRTVRTVRVKDIDRFVDGLSTRLSRRTVAGLCSSLRCFLRFLHATGRLKNGLADCIVAPRFRTDERPPRAVAWDVVRRIVHAIPRDHWVGQRDFAIFLLLASYGLGAGEVVSLRLEDIDWRLGVLRTLRCKTSVPLELPLLPAVARALKTYLLRGRPPNIPTREVFVTKGLPHRRLTTSALRHQLRKYADRAGVDAAELGTHVFRHSHATRQIDAGAHPKIVSDILGHKRPSSTSVYVRVAVQRLRSVALPVPR